MHKQQAVDRLSRSREESHFYISLELPSCSTNAVAGVHPYLDLPDGCDGSCETLHIGVSRCKTFSTTPPLLSKLRCLMATIRLGRARGDRFGVGAVCTEQLLFCIPATLTRFSTALAESVQHLDMKHE